MKKFLTVICSAMLLLNTPCYAKNVVTQNLITIAYGEKVIPVSVETPPIIRNDRVLIPYDVFEEFLKNDSSSDLSLSTAYDESTNEVIMTVKGEYGNILGTYTQYVQDYIIYKDNLNCYAGDVRSDMLNNKPYVSIRAFGSALVDSSGDPIFDLAWDNAQRRVIVKRAKAKDTDTGGGTYADYTGQ